jgi:hypothetical protein
VPLHVSDRRSPQLADRNSGNVLLSLACMHMRSRIRITECNKRSKINFALFMRFSTFSPVPCLNGLVLFLWRALLVLLLLSPSVVKSDLRQAPFPWKLNVWLFPAQVMADKTPTTTKPAQGAGVLHTTTAVLVHLFPASMQPPPQ